MTARTRISASIAAAHEEDALRQLLQSGRLIGSVTTSGSGFGFRLPVRLEAFGKEFVGHDPRCGGRVEGSAPLPQGRIAGHGGWTNVGLIPPQRPIVRTRSGRSAWGQAGSDPLIRQRARRGGDLTVVQKSGAKQSQRRSLLGSAMGEAKPDPMLPTSGSTARQRLPMERSVCRRVPLSTISACRLPRQKQASRSRQSSTGISAPYRAAISAGSGSTW
jgi:hypothetical protein